MVVRTNETKKYKLWMEASGVNTMFYITPYMESSRGAMRDGDRMLGTLDLTGEQEELMEAICSGFIGPKEEFYAEIMSHEIRHEGNV